MLGLTLREEFNDKRLKSTVIELSNESNTGAIQLASREFLAITYPTRDALKGIAAAGPTQGRPVVLIGRRGKGKSHLLGTLFHVMHDPASTREWLLSWAATLNDPRVGRIPLREGMLVIGESLQRQRYKFLWDLLFARHPHGPHVREKWEAMGVAKTDIPSDLSILELLRHTPTMLLLDEYQTWYDGLTNTKQYPWKTWAFNFIQMLSEIAKEHPDLLVLVVCLRNVETEAYRQIHRVNPVQIDFDFGASPERVREHRRMLLHRLFEDRLQLSPVRIDAVVAPHVAEYLRLLNIPSSEHEPKRSEFIEAWPFAPHLLELLEDRVLNAADAQETRDLIRILANLFKSRGECAQILTAADFRLNEQGGGIGALFDSVANEQHGNLRNKAQRNIASVEGALPDHARQAPHLREIMASLWLRSIAAGNLAGAEPAVLQVDVTRAVGLDDNAFQVELATIVENSFNIHQANGRLVLREDDNPQAKVMACARNDRLFRDGLDLVHLSKEIRHAVAGSPEVAKAFRVIALPKTWMTDPWSQLDDSERPNRWDDRATVLILPEDLSRIGERIGGWLKDHLAERRNTVRFVLPRSGSSPIYSDRELLVLTRAGMKALEWSHESPEYRKLHGTYQSALRDNLKRRFDRFAVLRRWNFADPRRCEVAIEPIKAQGERIPEAIENAIVQDVFVPEDFEEVVLQAAAENCSMGKLLKQLREPRAGGEDCIPWLGETAVKERVLRVCAKGKIAINFRGLESLQAAPGEEEDIAFGRLERKLTSTGRHLDEISLLLPSAVPAAGSACSPSVVQPEHWRERIFGPSNVLSSETCGRMPKPDASGGTPKLDASSGAEKPDASDGTGAGPTDVPSAPQDPLDVLRAGPSRAHTSLATAATSQLNLIGKIENWGIGPATHVSEVTIRVSSATGVQLRELLKKLPDGMMYELSLNMADS